MQAPVFPQTLLLVGQRPCGSALPAPTEVQVPLLPVTLQDWQSGQALAVVLQQTPSTHLPAKHWLSAPQEAPGPPALWQWLLESQKAPVAQSDAVVQLVLHPEVVQPYEPQGTPATTGQVVLEPEQTEAGV